VSAPARRQAGTDRQAGFRTFAGASFGVCGFSFKATPVFWDLLGLAICL